MRMTIFFTLLVFFPVLSTAQFTFPLQIGNRWQYKEPPPPADPYMSEDRVFGDTLMPNGVKYRAISDGLSANRTNYYYRQEGQRVFEFLTSGDSSHKNQEIVRFDFSKSLFDTVSVFQTSGLDTVVITVVDTGSLSVFGKVRPYKTFYWSERGGAFYRMNRIVDSLGTTFYQIEPGLQLYLVGAIINGVTYGQVVSVRERLKDLASDFALMQNYPNPFNPSTTIRFKCTHSSYGRLVLYDLSGRAVRTLVVGELTEGEHSIAWDGNIDRGTAAAAGAYIYRLEIGSTKLSRIMILLH